jgi:hypothetical protein
MTSCTFIPMTFESAKIVKRGRPVGSKNKKKQKQNSNAFVAGPVGLKFLKDAIKNKYSKKKKSYIEIEECEDIIQMVFRRILTHRMNIKAIMQIDNGKVGQKYIRMKLDKKKSKRLRFYAYSNFCITDQELICLKNVARDVKKMDDVTDMIFKTILEKRENSNVLLGFLNSCVDM